ncbi:hypothetical protein A2230_03970 [candidate division WOR-1 bacterium RIFOXYA2_FULL_36_21]|uniref:Outer membrane protein beta-barrel domain-containing protein n=1 Tax=candidate division WOR-1 bacterium RIFOXYB2_FULL_36_35 TaxID=1802578 RepID=A0A1F4S312_UNCSA|nr:MAG: hypothetical protein A2230_03970 [candidate division WOR-1 bacterium RIFOXYA2_FULL_36_21]OGC14123.1 MAG: hypothetical protein A2290_06440 [candidate division WOR-1 bacterium RIFOXYB2_FULL_36_35]OGC16501.1 MAG: hypothetical protein A2282_02070 [candidate division WOR-1 bacterium RIFOXYA12_FULL_36_13]
MTTKTQVWTGFLAIFIVMTLSIAAKAAPKHGVGLNYGVTNNCKMWAGSAANTGNALQVSYGYKFNDFYSAALEIGFMVDRNVFASTTNVYVETASYLNIKNFFYFHILGFIHPYLSIGTGLNGSNSWLKSGNKFYISGNNFFADILLGGGLDFGNENHILNFDFSFPAIFNTFYTNAQFPSQFPLISSFGYKYCF